jgi:CRISPR/Cas system endoribonuclease Cas6 (RAMP superfamily)
MDPDTVDMSSAEEVTIEHNNSRWYDWQRYSTRQDTDMKLGGIIGEVTYTGELEQFIPLLLLGEYIHVGKNTSFGLGKYIIS